MIKKLEIKSIVKIIFIASVLNNVLFAMDSVRVETRIDQAISQFGVTGQNVAVAIFRSRNRLAIR